MKCSICGEKLETTFLEKPIGTYIKVDGKKKTICNRCQSGHTMEEIKEKA